MSLETSEVERKSFDISYLSEELGGQIATAAKAAEKANKGWSEIVKALFEAGVNPTWLYDPDPKTGKFIRSVGGWISDGRLGTDVLIRLHECD